MTWTLSSVARTEQFFQRWQSLVTLVQNGSPTSFFISHGRNQPSDQQITDKVNEFIASLNEIGANLELASAIENEIMPALEFQTAGQLATRFRQQFQSASSEQAAKMAYWLIERIVAGDVTDTQIRNVFGLTAGEYTVAKAKFQALHDNWAAVLAAGGS